MEVVNLQLSSFVILLLTGMCLGFLMDGYRVLRSRIGKNHLITASGDLLFWGIAFLVMVPLIYWSTWFELRLYVWMAMGFGLLFYFLVFSRVIIPGLLILFKASVWLPRQILKLISQIKQVWLQLTWWQRKK